MNRTDEFIFFSVCVMVLWIFGLAFSVITNKLGPGVTASLFIIVIALLYSATIKD